MTYWNRLLVLIRYYIVFMLNSGVSFFFCNGRNVWHSEKLSYSIVISFVILTNLITEQHSVWEQDMEKIYIFWVVKLLSSDKKIFFCSNIKKNSVNLLHDLLSFMTAKCIHVSSVKHLLILLKSLLSEKITIYMFIVF